MTRNLARRFLLVGGRWLTATSMVALPACSVPVARGATEGRFETESSVAAPQTQVAADLAAAIRAQLARGTAPALASLSPVERADLERLYEGTGQHPLWIDLTGWVSSSARDALMLFEGAAAEGLVPGDYSSPRLQRLAAAIETTQSLRVEDVATFDLELSANMLRYLRHLHRGRIDPRAVGLQLDVPSERHDIVALLRGALGGGRITEMVADLTPGVPQYRALREMLARYRPLAATSLESLPMPVRSIHTGEPYAGLRALRQRLVTFGDLAPDTPAPGEGAVYGEQMAEGVKKFQIRHGLEADGVIGKATHAALSVPPAGRVLQIELALERLRWLSDLPNERVIALNTPMFYLWAWDSMTPSGAPSIGMKAIVGRAAKTETPVFNKVLREVIFRPYWNIPPSILHGEILPLVDRDPEYLHRHDMEIVRGAGDDARPVEATGENLALLERGGLRLRQRPGSGNALGLIKFIFPNEENVYLHGTPAQNLFRRARRDFSHGCVRVEDPVSLAEWVLRDEPAWTRERILAATADTSTDSQPVELARPIQVILFYTTAVVMTEDGAIRFAEDIYGHDATLDGALARRLTTR